MKRPAGTHKRPQGKSDGLYHFKNKWFVLSDGLVRLRWG